MKPLLSRLFNLLVVVMVMCPTVPATAATAQSVPVAVPESRLGASAPITLPNALATEPAIDILGVTVTAIAGGGHHTCAVVNGGVKCWGDNSYGQLGTGIFGNYSTPMDVSGLPAGSGVTAIAAGYGHTCAVVSGGVKCWGDNAYGQLGNGTTSGWYIPVQVSGLPAGSGATAITAGYRHTCAVVKGGVKCWGLNHDGELGTGARSTMPPYGALTPVATSGLPAGSGVTAVAAGAYHTCALVNGGAKCWGENYSGQLGDGTTTNRLAPVWVSGLPAGSRATAVTAGGHQTCALINSGVKCWGDNSFGQLGDGTTTERHLPTSVIGLPAGSGVTTVAAGSYHTCAAVSGGVKCWGGNGGGTLGDGTTTNHYAPGDVSGLAAGSMVTTIAAGYESTCALVRGGIRCWGYNYAGELGDGTTIKRSTPVGASGLTAGSGVIAVAAGDYYTCSLMGGGVKCWGENMFGPLGDGTAISHYAPADVSNLPAGSNATAIAAGYAHACAVVDGGVECWGSNLSGGLGDGTTTNHPTPVGVSGLPAGSGATALAAGDSYTCAVVNGGVKCWGANYGGQLGNGATTNSSIPVDVSGLPAGSGVTAITAGDAHTCVVVGGGVKCWGYNIFGELGDGTTTSHSAPVSASGLPAGSGVTAIAARFRHTCALVNGGVLCWGLNNYGQLGNGSTADWHFPVQVSGLPAGSGVTAIAAGSYHSCAAVSGGALCWGDNEYGQLGDGTTFAHSTPLWVSGLPAGSGVFAMTAGVEHTCVVVNGGVNCWGDNSEGQLGADPGWTPVDVVGLEPNIYSISGQVTDGVNPIPGVEVVADFTHRAFTDINGNYTITGLDAGAYTLDARGHNSFTPAQLPVSVPPSQTGQDFTLVPVDLSIDSVSPVQVLEGQALVQGKATAIKVVVHRTEAGAAYNVPVQVTYNSNTYQGFYVAELGNMDANYALRDDNRSWHLDMASDEITKTVYFFSDDFAPTGSTFQVAATVDAPNVVSETIETNNTPPDPTSVAVSDVTWTGSLFPNLYIHYFTTDWGSTSLAAFDAFYQASNKFLQGVYPIAEARFTPGKSSNIADWYYGIGNTGSYRGPDGKLDEHELSQWAADTLRDLRIAHPTADKYIAVVPDGWFSAATTQPAGILGVTPELTTNKGVFRDLVITEVQTGTRPDNGGPQIVAHEIGHSYGLPNIAGCKEEYDPLCNPSIQDKIGNYAAPGMWVNERILIQNSSSRPTYCFMSKYVTGGEVWIDSSDYSKLASGRPSVTGLDTSTSLTPTQAILAVGTFAISGSVTLDNWYVLPEAELAEPAPGPYAFEYQDSGGAILYQQSFDVSYSVGAYTVTETPFVETIPYVTGTAKIVVKYNDVALGQKVISPNSPTVTVLTPNGGERLRGQVNIQWSGSDGDADGLTYVVLISADNGASWEPLAGELTATSYPWDTSQLPGGAQYLIKVVATDGFNTGEDVSDAPFSIVGRASFLPLVRR